MQHFGYFVILINCFARPDYPQAHSGYLKFDCTEVPKFLSYINKYRLILITVVQVTTTVLMMRVFQ